MFGDPSSNPKGWDICLIDDVIAEFAYGTSQKANDEYLGYPILGMPNLTYSGRIDLTKLAHISLSQEEFKDLKLEHGDVLFNRTNSTELVGKTAVWDKQIDAVAASYLIRIRLASSTNPYFFSSQLNTPHFKKVFQQRCKKAVGQSNFSPTLLKELPLFLPPLELQRKFARVVQRHERLRAQQLEGVRLAQGLYDALLHQAFADA